MMLQHPFHALLPPQALYLRRRALRLTANEHRAEDLAQDTLLKAWANRDSYKPETNLRAWLFTILRNTFFSELRKRRREVEDIDEVKAQALAEEPRQEHALALKELIAASAQLPDVQRHVLFLMGAYGYSQEETADACGCTVGTVKSRVSRGRTALSRLLGEDTTGQIAQLHSLTAPRPAASGAAGPSFCRAAVIGSRRTGLPHQQALRRPAG